VQDFATTRSMVYGHHGMKTNQLTDHKSPIKPLFWLDESLISYIIIFAA
jgi:hypothetical protein